MKRFFLPLLFSLAFSELATTQTLFFDCDNPSTRDIRDVYLGFEADHILGISPYSPGVSLKICDPTIVHNTVLFKFPDFTALLAYGRTMRINFGDGTPSAVASPSGTITHTYPLNTCGAPVVFQVSLTYAFLNGDPVGPTSVNVPLRLNQSNPVNGGAFSPPGNVQHVNGPASVPPPIANAFPTDPYNNIFNGNTVGGADVYIQYAPSHNYKLLKPLIFVDGIDFNPKTYTYNGTIVRHGDSGWDLYQMGNDNSAPNSFNSDPTPTYRNYPATLSMMGASPNDYDIVFVDFVREPTGFSETARC